jgi:carbon-monoxide dehydrogenase medium subunit
MPLPEFDLLQPKTLAEALNRLETTPSATPLAGGTCLLVDLRGRKRFDELLLDLSGIGELRGIVVDGDDLVIGAATTIGELLRSPEVGERAGLLREACTMFAAPLVRNRATIGGNLLHASPAADTAPPLLALDAAVELQSSRGKRVVPLHEFFVGPCETQRKADELATAIRVPIPWSKTRWAYEKLRLRKADAISVVSVAAVALPSENGFREVRIGLGAVAPTPIRARKAEPLLKESKPTDEAVVEAARLAAEVSRPIDDIRGSANSRRRAVEALARRCLARLVDSSWGETDDG